MKKIKKKKTWAEYECIDQYNKDLSNPYSSINTALKITPNELSLCPLLCKQVKTLVFSTAKCKMSAVARRILRICSFCACGVREKKHDHRPWLVGGIGNGSRAGKAAVIDRQAVERGDTHCGARHQFLPPSTKYRNAAAFEKTSL